MSVGPKLMKLFGKRKESKSGKISYLWLLCKFTWVCKNMDFSKLDFLTSFYHNSTNNGPIEMFFTKKCNYFSWERRWNHPFESQYP